MHLIARVAGAAHFVESAIALFGQTPVLTHVSDSHDEASWLCPGGCLPDNCYDSARLLRNLSQALLPRSASGSRRRSAMSDIMQRALDAARQLANTATAGTGDFEANFAEFADLMRAESSSPDEPSSPEAMSPIAASAVQSNLTRSSVHSRAPFIDFGLSTIAMLEAAASRLDPSDPRSADAIERLRDAEKEYVESCATRVGVVTNLMLTIVSVLLETTGVRSETIQLREAIVHELAVRPATHSQLSKRVPTHLSKHKDFDEVLLDVAERVAGTPAISRKNSSQKFQLKSHVWKEYQGLFWRRYSKQGA
jgi:E3 ubiquitin-protein ligase UBR1-like, winged-helix domain